MLQPDFLLQSIYNVDDEFIEKNGIKGIIFDIDNTLVGFTVKEPDEKIKEYISRLKEKGIQVAIASNNSASRVNTFCKDLDILHYSRACKPLPFCILKIAKQMKLRTRNILLVGDQVFTDSLGANLIGMKSVMVDIIDTKETLSFKIKRALEKPVIYAKKRKDNRKNG